MTCIHDNEVNNISECYLLHDIINPPRCTKHLNSHYSPIIHGCINTRKAKTKFSKFRILLDSGCSFAVVMGRLVEIIHPKKDDVMQWHTQANNITTNPKVEVYFTLPELSATNAVTWKFHMDVSAKGRYDMMLGRDVLT